MRPFNPSLANQIQAKLPLQQGMHFNNPPFPPQNPAAFNQPHRGTIHPHGGNPSYNNQNAHLNSFHGAGTGVPNYPNPMNHMGALLPPQGQLPAVVVQLLQQQQQQQNIMQLQQNHLIQLQSSSQNLGASMASVQMGQNVLLGGQQVLPSHFPQQQQPLSSMQTSNVALRSQPGNVGMSQMALLNSNSNFGNAMLPNEGMQFKNQNQLIAPSTAGQQQPMNSMQTVNAPPLTRPGSVVTGQMVRDNSNARNGNYTLPNKAMQRKNQNHHQFSSSSTTGRRQPVSSMQTVNASLAQMVTGNSNAKNGNCMLPSKAMQCNTQNHQQFNSSSTIGRRQPISSMQTVYDSPAQMGPANSSPNLGNSMIYNETLQFENQNMLSSFNVPRTQGQQLHVNSTQTINVPPGQMVPPNAQSAFNNTMLHSETRQLNPTITGPQQQMSSMQTFNAPLPVHTGFVEAANIVMAALNSNMGNSMLCNAAMQSQNLCHFASSNTVQSSNHWSSAATPMVPSLPVITQQTWMNMESNGNLQPQVNCVADGGYHMSGAISGSSACKQIARSSLGIRKPQFHNRKNATGYKTRTNNDRRGQPCQRRGDQFSGYNGNAQAGQKRLVPFNYTKGEVKQWRAARKRNFPTKANLKNRFKRGRKRYTEAKLRRQELRKILAKQAELGVDVADIPARYLIEPKDRKSRNKNHSSNSHHMENHKEVTNGDVVRREPTLLQKLLSSDIKRDRSGLLQVLRFMTLNNFFQQWPDEPLEFPVVTVKDLGCDIDENLLLKEADCASPVNSKGAMDDEASKGGGCGDNEEVGDQRLEEDEEPEEGEILD